MCRRFRRGLGIVSLYEEMREEVRELRGYYERKAERRVGKMLGFLTFVGLPIGVLADIFGSALVQRPSSRHFVLIAMLAYAMVSLAWFLWQRRGRE